MRRIAVEVGGDATHRDIGIFNHNEGTICAPDLIGDMLAYDNRGTTRYRLGDKVVSVNHRTLNRKEATTRRHLSRVVGKRSYLNILSALYCHTGNTLYNIRKRHHFNTILILSPCFTALPASTLCLTTLPAPSISTTNPLLSKR